MSSSSWLLSIIGSVGVPSVSFCVRISSSAIWLSVIPPLLFDGDSSMVLDVFRGCPSILAVALEISEIS